jgi:hypothetical protein
MAGGQSRQYMVESNSQYAIERAKSANRFNIRLRTRNGTPRTRRRARTPLFSNGLKRHIMVDLGCFFTNKTTFMLCNLVKEAK